MFEMWEMFHPFKGGEGEPTPDCCSGLREVVGKSFKCVCVLIKDRDDPQLGIKLNVTRALLLSSLCGAPGNVSDCPRLLDLPKDSPDAKVFYQFGNEINSTSAQGNTHGVAAAAAGSGAGRAEHEMWPGISVASGVWILGLLSLYPLLMMC